MAAHNSSRDMRDLFSFEIRENAVCIDLKDALPTLSQKDAVSFLRNDLKVGPPDVLDICLHNVMQVLMVKFKDELTCNRMKLKCSRLECFGLRLERRSMAGL